MSLSSRAILVGLTLRCWTGTETRNPDDTNNLDPERDRILHALVPRHVLDAPRKYARLMREAHTRMTAPWDDNGLRMLPSNRLLEYSNKIREMRMEYDTIVDAAIPQIRARIDQDYQGDIKLIRDKFSSKLTFYPVPDANLPDMVNIVDAAVRAEVIEAINADTNAKTETAAKSLGEHLMALHNRRNAIDLHRVGGEERFEQLTEQMLSLADTFHTLKPELAPGNGTSIIFNPMSLQEYLRGR